MSSSTGKKTALITGAAGGIGSALCAVFVEAGYGIVALDKKPCEFDVDAFVMADLGQFCREESYRTQVVAEVISALGTNELHALINNAAVQILGGVDEVTAGDLSESLDVNVTAPLLLTQGVLSCLEAAKGSIVNISSVHAGATKPGFIAYATSKAALVGLTRAMAVDLGARVRVNSLSPGATATSMLKAGFEGDPEAYAALAETAPVGRIADPREVADAALFLVSGAARFITGSCLAVDGGVGVRLHDPE